MSAYPIPYQSSPSDAYPIPVHLLTGTKQVRLPQYAGPASYAVPSAVQELEIPVKSQTSDESEESDPDEEEVQEAAHEASMQATRKRLASEPDGNLYRGWAIDIQKGNRQKLLTFLIIGVQLLGPFSMLIWGSKELARGKTMSIFTFVFPDCENVDTAALAGCEKPLRAEVIILNKFLGFILMGLLYLNGDAILDRMDRQTDRLRQLYPTLKKGWMFIDAFCNSWAVAVSAFATPFLVFSCYEAKDLILDAFGLLFLQSIDDYSASIEFGIETSDFDEIIDIREFELAKEEQQHLLLKDTPGHTDQASGSNLGDVRNLIFTRCIHGDFVFSFARLLNQVAGCLALPAFALIQWYPPESPPICLCPGAQTVEKTYVLNIFWGEHPYCLYIGIAMMLMICVANGFRAADYYNASMRPPDCISFIWQVLLSGRGDPRLKDPDKFDDDL